MISSAQNHRVKGIRRLRGRQGGARAARDSRLLLEGSHLVEAALARGLELEEILLTEAFAGRERELLARLPPERTHLVTPELLAETADADAPQGLVAVARFPEATLDDLPRPGLWVVVDRLQDPGNVGALARSCEAFGARGLLLLPGSAHWRHPRALRASAGSLLRLPCVQSVEVGAVDSALGGRSAWWVLERTGTRTVVEVELEPGASAVLVVGSESHGPRAVLGDAGIASRRHTVAIPVGAAVESLNATVAASIALWELAGRPRTPAPQRTS